MVHGRSRATTTASASSARRRLTPRKRSARRVNPPSKAGRHASAAQQRPDLQMAVAVQHPAQFRQRVFDGVKITRP